MLVAADRDGRLCLFAPADPIGTPSRPRLGRLRPNATVYVVGRPRGLEATFAHDVEHGFVPDDQVIRDDPAMAAPPHRLGA